MKEMQEMWGPSLGWEDSLEEGMATHSSSSLENPHGQRTLVGYSPWGCKGSDTTERLTFSTIPGYLWLCPGSGASPDSGASLGDGASLNGESWDTGTSLGNGASTGTGASQAREHPQVMEHPQVENFWTLEHP